jgi:predicted SAM-dependent methyltransferase
MNQTAYRTARWAYQPLKQATRLAIKLRAVSARRSVIHNYLAAPGFKGLQIGSGEHNRRGWLNSDLPGTLGIDIGMDITEPLPFPDQSFHAIYGSEVVEHIPKEAVGPFLNEAFRILQKEGVLRLTTPNLAEICRIALGISDACTVEQISTIWLDDEVLTKDIWINAMFRSWGHQYLWDFDSLKVVLTNAGFSKVDLAEPQITKSVFPELANQETRYGMPPPPFMWATSLIVEATK